MAGVDANGGKPQPFEMLIDTMMMMMMMMMTMMALNHNKVRRAFAL